MTGSLARGDDDVARLEQLVERVERRRRDEELLPRKLGHAPGRDLAELSSFRRETGDRLRGQLVLENSPRRSSQRKILCRIGVSSEEETRWSIDLFACCLGRIQGRALEQGASVREARTVEHLEPLACLFSTLRACRRDLGCAARFYSSSGRLDPF